jgi:hypothetical protein
LANLLIAWPNLPGAIKTGILVQVTVGSDAGWAYPRRVTFARVALRRARLAKPARLYLMA